MHPSNTSSALMRNAIDIPVFLITFFAGPLVFTGLTFWIGGITYYALLIGGPFYIVIGLPLAVWHLRRHAAEPGKIMGLSLVSLLTLVPLFGLLALYNWDIQWMLFAPFFMAFGVIFAPAWSGCFALLYVKLARV